MDTPPIAEGHRANFNTLLKAAANGDLALMSCLDTETKEPRAVICAVSQQGGEFVFTPFGHLAEGNPFDLYLPPEA